MVPGKKKKKKKSKKKPEKNHRKPLTEKKSVAAPRCGVSG
jgi:hypothetical protein